jgi:hypothetical protein
LLTSAELKTSGRVPSITMRKDARATMSFVRLFALSLIYFIYLHLLFRAYHNGSNTTNSARFDEAEATAGKVLIGRALSSF